jgi:hypothetical protein
VRRFPALTRLIAALLLMQWGTAFAHCLKAAAPAAFAVEICTADGIHRVSLPIEDGDRREDRAAASVCPACQGPAAFALPAPEARMPGAPLWLAQTANPPPPPPSPPLPLPPRSCQPRAPPTS